MSPKLLILVSLLAISIASRPRPPNSQSLLTADDSNSTSPESDSVSADSEISIAIADATAEGEGPSDDIPHKTCSDVHHDHDRDARQFGVGETRYMGIPEHHMTHSCPFHDQHPPYLPLRTEEGSNFGQQQPQFGQQQPQFGQQQPHFGQHQPHYEQHRPHYEEHQHQPNIVNPQQDIAHNQLLNGDSQEQIVPILKPQSVPGSGGVVTPVAGEGGTSGVRRSNYKSTSAFILLLVHYLIFKVA